jgi:hypothetical protein
MAERLQPAMRRDGRSASVWLAAGTDIAHPSSLITLDESRRETPTSAF